jgi:dolichol-phosphate mannosyltransferase
VQITLVAPTYQERDNIEGFLTAVREALPDAHVLVCDDNSPDGTATLAEKVGADLGQIEVLHRPTKEGLGAAYRQGFRHAIDAGAQVVVQMDADFSHPPAMLPQLVAEIERGADVAVGSRYVHGGGTPDWSLHRKLLSHYGNIYARAQLRLVVLDATSGFRAYRTEILEQIRFDTTRTNGYGFQIETAYRLTAASARIVEVPLVFHDRVHGLSKMSVPIMVENTALVTWWGLCLRAPAVTNRFRDTAAGRYLAERTTPST